jgi:N-acetylmuramoyl-L-alanine amidase
MANHTKDRALTRIEQGLAALGYPVSHDSKLDMKAIRRFYAEKMPDAHYTTPERLLGDLKTAIIDYTDALIARPSLSPFETGRLQQRLQWLGLYNGKIDRDDGRLTKNAVHAFKERYGSKEEDIHVTSQCPPHSSKGVIVVLDAGHGLHQGGSYDTGARAGKKREADITMEQVKKLAAKLTSGGVKVVLTRDHDFDANDPTEERVVQHFKSQTDSLKHRVNIARKEAKEGNEVLFVSLHADVAVKKNGKRNPEPHGIRIHYGRKDAASKQFADSLVEEFNDANGTDKDDCRKDNPAKSMESGFLVLKNNGRAVLVEMGFLSNKGDLNRLCSKAGQENIAEQIADGIQQYIAKKNLHTPGKGRA